MKRLAIVLAVAALMVAFVGCKGEGAGEAKKVAVPEKAADVAKMAETALKAGDVNALWQIVFPENYRKDLQGLVDEAKKVDAELYNKAMALVPKAIAALEKNPQMLEGAPVKMEDIKKIVKIVEDAGLMTHEGLQKFNLDAFVAAHGKTLFDMGKVFAGEQAAMLDKVTLEVIDEKEAEATLVVKVDGKEMEKVALVKDGKAWVSKEMKDGWAKQMEEAKAGITAGLAQTTGEAKAQAIQMIDGFGAALDSGNLQGLPIPGM